MLSILHDLTILSGSDATPTQPVISSAAQCLKCTVVRRAFLNQHDMEMMQMLLPHTATRYAKGEDNSILTNMKRTETILASHLLGTY